MKLNNLIDKKVAIWGMGREGQSLAHLFEKKNIAYTVLDGDDVDLSCFDVVFKSPGISFYHPAILKAPKVQLSSSTNLYMDNRPSDICTIAVTGTKGKSTTSSLLAHILKSMGFSVGLGGNIGVPLVELLDKKFDYLVAELSSYQCTDLALGFDYSVLVNLYPEHIDWHKTHERYYADKVNLLRVRQKGKPAFVNKLNLKSLSLTDTLSDIFYFNDPNGIHLSNGFFMNAGTKLFKTDCITNLKGEHNLENICAVLSVIKALHLPLENIEKHIVSFQALPHRLQTVAEVEGVSFVDDSISTTPETTIAALKAFEGKTIYLLVGGYDRKQNYEVLNQYLQTHPQVHVIGLPHTGVRVFGAKLVSNVAQGVQEAQKKAQVGDVVLLSPGAPSYHAYKNFEERGADFFKNIDLSLISS